jgi:quercetin 2,3-dioxygenase
MGESARDTLKGVGVSLPPALLEIRPDASIYAANGDWFKARWHFSFDEYYDPSNMRVGLLRVFNHDTLIPGAAWPLHPHRNIEGITYVVDGHFEHADSLGNEGVLEPGGVQRMTLGVGAWHSERNHSQTESMESIQMWIMPDTPGLLPEIEQRQFSIADRSNRILQVLKPMNARGDAVSVHQDVSVYVSHLEPDIEIEHVFRESRGGYLYLITGALSLNGHSITTGDAAKIRSSGRMTIHATATSELLFVDTPLELPKSMVEV